MTKKAVIAMSGGVDSSVSALLYKKEGIECTGIMMKLHRQKEPIEGVGQQCGSSSDAEDARAIANRLEMPFELLDYAEEFKSCIIDYFIEAYQTGCTPNPCIKCNRHMKFGKIYEYMQKQRMDLMVTGHYAQVEYDEGKKQYVLKKAIDQNKDQSYFLYVLTREQLSHVRFPLGSMTKEEVRKIAEEHQLINARKKDSQDVCFVPDGDYVNVIAQYSGNTGTPGKFVDQNGSVLGQHEGITHYTIGQRRGLRISAKQRIYVTDINVEENTVVLGSNEDLFHRELIADDVNLLTCEYLEKPIRVNAKIRYRHKEQPAIAWQDEEGKLHVKFDEPQRAITKGQSVVMYEGDIVVGGAVIREVVKE